MRPRIPRFVPGPLDDLLAPAPGSKTARALMSLARRSRFEGLKRCDEFAAPDDLGPLQALRRVTLAHLPGDPYVVSDVLADPWVAEPLDAALRRAPFPSLDRDAGQIAFARALRRFVDLGTLPTEFEPLATHAAGPSMAPLARLELPPLSPPWDEELPRTLALRGPPGGPPRLRVARTADPLDGLPGLAVESMATKILALDLVTPLAVGDDIDVLRALIEVAGATLRTHLGELGADADAPTPSEAQLTDYGRAIRREIDVLRRTLAPGAALPNSP